MKKLIIILFLMQILTYAKPLKIAVISPKGNAFVEFRKGLAETLNDAKLVLFEELKEDLVLDSLTRNKWDAIVALDNISLRTVEKYQLKLGLEKSPPIFAAMVLQLEKEGEDVKNLHGIHYEIPAFTIFTHLRKISETPFDKVLVIHRKSFSDYLFESEKTLNLEKIKLKKICVDCETSLNKRTNLRQLKMKFNHLKKSHEFDVIWVLADNLLVSPQFIRSFWKPYVIKKSLPLVVPVENWVNPKTGFGMMGVGPNYHEMGVQLADQLLLLSEDPSEFNKLKIERLISIQTSVNLHSFMEANWDVNHEELIKVHKVYK